MTTDDRIQAGLDGTLKSEEAAELQARLQADPASLSQQRLLMQVDLALKNIKPKEAPSDLCDNVMRQVRLSQAPALNAHTYQPRGLRAWWQKLAQARPVFQVGLGFALGVIVLLPLVQTFRLPSVDPGSVSGTLAAPRGSAIVAEHTIPISGPDLSGSVTAQLEGGDIVYHLTLASPQPVVARLEFDSPILGLASFAADSPKTGSLTYSDRGLELSQEGEGRYTIRMAAPGGTMPEAHLTVVRNGETLFGSEIR